MIWYHLPVTFGAITFLVLLVTTVFQALISLAAGELFSDKSALSFIRLLYGSLAAISAVLTLEALHAMASIEGGVFLAIPSLYRYASVLPALVFIFSRKNFAKLPPGSNRCF